MITLGSFYYYIAIFYFKMLLMQNQVNNSTLPGK